MISYKQLKRSFSWDIFFDTVMQYIFVWQGLTISCFGGINILSIILKLAHMMFTIVIWKSTYRSNNDITLQVSQRSWKYEEGVVYKYHYQVNINNRNNCIDMFGCQYSFILIKSTFENYICVTFWAFICTISYHLLIEKEGKLIY